MLKVTLFVSVFTLTSSSQSTYSMRSSKDAPVVPFGLDLYYWGEEQPNAGKIFKYDL